MKEERSGQLWLTKRIDAKLEELKDAYGVHIIRLVLVHSVACART